MLRLRALECTVLTIPHTCMYDTYKAIYKLSKLKYPHGRTDERTDERTFVLLELLSQLKSVIHCSENNFKNEGNEQVKMLLLFQ